MKAKKIQIRKILMPLLLLLINTAFADGIISISPDNGDDGTTVSVTIILDSGSIPEPPPFPVQPSAVKIGALDANTFNRTNETTITAEFDIPAGMSAGYYDVNVTFDPPGITLGLTSGFQVNGEIIAETQTVGLFTNESEAWPGYTLFTPITYDVVYLIDINGQLVHSWNVSSTPALSVYLLENGHLVHTTNNAVSPFSGTGGDGGQINEYDWDGNLVWTYNYASADNYCSHHDVEVLPNGNYLIVAWEKKTEAEAIQAGRDPSTITEGELWPDHIIEVTPNYGSGSGGTIVWEWHVWDHLIQDYDNTKDNYGVVADHPELIDINYAESGMGGTYSADWTHINSVEYIEAYDQILFSVHSFSEVWIIDHSTTTAEAASHTGGTYGKGGDLLYRWGNPQTYGAGNAADQKFYSQHDASWIEEPFPGSGNIMVFNNGSHRTGGDSYSSIDEITPPDDGSGNYSYSSGNAYSPTNLSWEYTSTPTDDFYSMNISGAQRLPNGNTLICNGNYGSFFEVNNSGDIVWHYINPVTTNGPLTQGDEVPAAGMGVGTTNQVFNCRRYATDYPAFTGVDLTPQGTIEYGSVGTSSDIIFIDGTNGSDANDGLGWGTAMKTIQTGIDKAELLGYDQVWVKSGSYYATTGTDRSASINLADGIKLYGGFSGTETEVSERTDYGIGGANETILSGDIGALGDDSDNTYRILLTGNGCTVDGLSFTKSYANGEFTERMGGAIYMGDDASDVNNCSFIDNYAEAGGAIYVFNINGDGSSSYQTSNISNCVFLNNNANLGGALVLRVGATCNLTNCNFENNNADWRGGAIFIDYGAYETYPIIIDGCSFISNNSNGNGGAIYCDDMASQLQGTYWTVQNCDFTSNSTSYRGGAICTYNTNNFATIQNNTFTSNTAGLAGTAIAGDNGVDHSINNNTLNTGQTIDLDEECSCSGNDCP